MPILPVDKPLGLSSHAAVVDARRRLGRRRVGHAGTLDPLATGVLVLLVGGATKLSPFLTSSDKGYLAWVAFGAGTATLDAEGPVTSEADASFLDAALVAAALPPFLELREQRPPAFSAIKREGERSYRRARRGEEVTLPARPAGYLELELLAFAADREALPAHVARDEGGGWRPAASGYRPDLPPALAPLPTGLVRARVRAGTYLRAFARDLGAALGVPAHLSGLVRTDAGRIGLERTTPLSALERAAGVAPADALPYPTIRLEADAARRVRLGQRPPGRLEGRVAMLDPDGRLVAVAEAAGDRVSLLRVWAGDDD